MQALSKLDFPYFLATQNGADIISMPENKLLQSHYLDKKVALKLQDIYTSYPEDFIVYSGFERNDFCYFRPNKYSEKRLEDVLKFQKTCSTNWVEVDDFKEVVQVKFPMIKCIGIASEFKDIEKELLKTFDLTISCIKNPKSPELDLLLITDQKASKCQAVQFLMDSYNLKRPLIAAGDDYNDASNLKLADIAIVMETAPKQLLSIADIIAKDSKSDGIIEAMKIATDKLS